MKPLDIPIWWTWDHSTNWVVTQPGKQTIGASNDYAKAPSAFVTEYCRAIDWAAAQGVGAIGIAGLLRDRHGGIEAARAVTRHGREREVLIYGIAGLGSYGGVYYEGNSPWSLERFLAEHPACLGTDADGRPLVNDFGIYGPRPVRHGCPSHPRLQDFVLRSVEWLFRMLPELGGLAFETGDTGVCQCARCQRRRQVPADALSLDDMALYYPKVVAAIFSVQPEALAICETYHHFLPQRDQTPAVFGAGLPAGGAELLSAVPQGAVFQWVCDEWLTGDWPEGAPLPLPGHGHIMRAHFGTYWWGSSRHRLEIANIRTMCRLSAASGLNRVSVFGESSPFHANAEFNYLAAAYFSANPMASVGDFCRTALAPRLGGEDAAHDYVSGNDRGRSGDFDEAIFDGIARHALETTGRARRRWLWLGSYLAALAADRESPS